MPTRRNPAVRAQQAFSAPSDPRTALAAWPAFAKALHTAAVKIDEATAVRFRRLAASAGTVAGWNERATVGSEVPDPGVLALAKEISETDPIRDRAKAAARLDAIAWAASGTLLSRVHDHLGEVRVSGINDVTTEIRDLRRTRATIAAANIQAEVDHRGTEPPGVAEPLATWEAHAGRLVAKTPTTLALWAVAVRQEVNSEAMIGSVEHHYRHGGLDGLDTERVLESLEADRRAWGDVRDSLAPLAVGARPLPPGLVVAGEEAGAHLKDLRHGSVRQLRANLAVFLAGSVNLAATTTSAIESGQLYGPAAAINRRAMELRPAQEAAHVSAVDLHQRRTVPVGELVQSDLTFQSLRLRDSLEWTANVARVSPDPWAQRSGRRPAPHLEVPPPERGQETVRDL